ncbi:MAG: tRNA (adenosine(37)-N6)-dimethylallyltransferase MiaA [Magnetococcales bacterium]|nr:tRNA (adenosine(37)-N6)-dimethylallyltransferase MiaA [Magnetococcales bacterium]
MSHPTPHLVTILGPTASGKTNLGVRLALTLNGEILSADSRQIFRGMDIGTGKDLAEYQQVRHHLIDILAPGTPFSLFDFTRAFAVSFAEIVARGRQAILVGGTGLYLDAVLRGYSLTEVPPNPKLREELSRLDLPTLQERLRQRRPAPHNTTDLLDRERLVRAIEIAEGEDTAPAPDLPSPDHPCIPSSTVFGLRWPREELHRRIDFRLRSRLDQGLIEEVASLRNSGVSDRTLLEYGLEYRLVTQFLTGEIRNRNDLFQKLRSAIHAYAKRQETWFRGMERKGVTIHWLQGDLDPFAEAMALLGTRISPPTR